MKWTDRPTLSWAEAAEVSGISERQLRAHAAAGNLETHTLPAVRGAERGQTLVKVRSLMALLGMTVHFDRTLHLQDWRTDAAASAMRQMAEQMLQGGKTMQKKKPIKKGGKRPGC